jgi:two-component system, response regulator
MPERRCAEILLVEDSPDDVELTLHALTKARVDNKVTVARDGAEALDYLFGTGALPGRCCLETPLVVLLDLKLPKVSGGIEVLRRIRSDPRTHAVPVIALTSSRRAIPVSEESNSGVRARAIPVSEREQFRCQSIFSRIMTN